MTTDASWLHIDPADVEGRDLYFLLNSIVVPRPIAWISTLSATGVANVAPHSYTTVLSPNPPIVCFVSVGEKDSLTNARATGDFVYNLAGEELIDAINRTAADFPPEVSEFEWAGLTAVPSVQVKSPRVAEAPISLESKLLDIQQIASTRNFLVSGEVVAIHLHERIMTGDRVDPRKLAPVGRLSGSLYSKQGDLISLQRPTYAGLREEKHERVGEP